MITAIRAIGFKNLDFDHHIEPLTIFLGPNGAGKSARTQAAILALNGYIPGSAKTNAAILENYGAGDKLVVGVRIDGKLFERGFVRSNDRVGQGFKIDGKKASDSAFAMALGQVGAPKLIDVSAFMDLSSQKRIDAIFDLYPPEEDVGKLTEQIEAAKATVNALAAKARASEEAAARLTASKAEIQLPAGNYAELCFEIRETEKRLEEARKDLVEAEIDAAKAKGVEEEKARAVAEAAVQSAAAKETQKPGPLEQEINQRFGPEGTINVPGHGTVFTAAGLDTYSAAIQEIINAINEAGCSACVARLVAIREMRKIRGKEASHENQS